MMKPTTKLTRRQMLRLSAGSLLAAGLWPGSLHAEGDGHAEAFHFLVVNDVHYLDQHCGHWLEKVIRQMKGHPEAIDFCLLVGDLAEHGHADQLHAVRDCFRKLGKPTYVVVGNHDYNTHGDRKALGERKAFEELFPERINYQFEHRGWQFVGLDTTEGRKALGVRVQPTTLRWLDDHVRRLDRKRPTIVFTHLPLGPWVLTRPTNADRVLEPFREHNLQAVFCGHWHGFTERHVGAATLTTDRCCSFWHPNHDGDPRKGYFLCHARNGKVQRTFVDVPLA